MHSGETKIVDLVGEHLQSKEKSRMAGKGRVGVKSRRGRERRRDKSVF
jgi:hypothetical protein